MQQKTWPFFLTKAEVRVLVEFSKLRSSFSGQPWTVFFQPKVKDKSRIIASDGFTLAVCYGPPAQGEDFGIPHLNLAALYRAMPARGKLYVGAKDDKTIEFRVTGGPFEVDVMEGVCPRDPKPKMEKAAKGPKLADYLKALPRTRYEKMLDGGPLRRGFDPKFLGRLAAVTKAAGNNAVEWCLIGDNLDPVQFAIRNSEGTEKWRVVIMPVRI